MALGCFGSDPNARAAFGDWNHNFVICITKIVSGAPASTPKKPPPRAQIEGTWQRKVSGCRGAAGVALGCFGSDPNARAAFGYWNQNFVICTTDFVTGQNALQRHRKRISGCQIAHLGGRGDSTCKILPWKGRITKFRTAGAIFVIRHLVGYLNRTPMYGCLI